jgi:16S rRNA (cytidine1402-2'-O)-methyltransferase
MSKLILVPTPIGNLDDMTLRAIQVLKSSDLILSEDTRRSLILLKNFEIHTPLQSFHDHSGPEKLKRIIEQVAAGKTVAYITDAGTPGISDPGFVLVREALKSGVPVEVLPGPSALLPALVLSGLPCERFVFEGFLPQKAGKRRKTFEEHVHDKRTLVFFESPYKLLAHLREALEVLGDRRAAVVRELTKKFEEIVRGRISELIQDLSGREVRGEIVVVVEGSERES